MSEDEQDTLLPRNVRDRIRDPPLRRSTTSLATLTQALPRLFSNSLASQVYAVTVSSTVTSALTSSCCQVPELQEGEGSQQQPSDLETGGAQRSINVTGSSDGSTTAELTVDLDGPGETVVLFFCFLTSEAEESYRHGMVMCCGGSADEMAGASGSLPVTPFPRLYFAPFYRSAFLLFAPLTCFVLHCPALTCCFLARPAIVHVVNSCAA